MPLLLDESPVVGGLWVVERLDGGEIPVVIRPPPEAHAGEELEDKCLIRVASRTTREELFESVDVVQCYGADREKLGM